MLGQLVMKKNVFFLAGLLTALMTAQPLFAQGVQGKAGEGEKKAYQCIGCHGLEGYHASFPEVYRVPKIAGQSAKYLVAALVAYQKGERKHPSMRGIVSNMTEQDMADVSAFYEEAGARSKRSSESRSVGAEVEKLLEKGGCKGCHGADMNKPIDPAYPKLAGQYSDYLFVALKSYKVEPNMVSGRSNAIMGGIAKQFSNSELKAISNYLASMPGDVAVLQQNKFR